MAHAAPMSAAASRPAVARPRSGGPLAVVGYVGGLGRLVAEMGWALVHPGPSAVPLFRAVPAHWPWLVGWGVPLSCIGAVSLGMFLAVQSVFGATFVDATGAVVGVGMSRDLATLITGFVLSGLCAARITMELRTRPHTELDREPGWVPDRDLARGRVAETRQAPAPGRLALVRVVSAMMAGPVVSAWCGLVGFLMGWLVAETVLHQSSVTFLHMAGQMVWLRDIAGIFFKGVLFGGVTSLLACHEGLRGEPGEPVESAQRAAFRAAAFGALAVVALNAAWFGVVYLAGAPFGPTVLKPPAHQ